MQLPSGGFASSLDADTDHEEGLTYVWSWDELQEVLGGDFETFARIHGVTPSGNFEGSNILNRLDAESREWLGETDEDYLLGLRDVLLSRRNERPQPGATTRSWRTGTALRSPDWLMPRA